MLLARKDKLAFPAGVAPGFDPKHVAAQNVVVSAVATPGANFVNLMTGLPFEQGGGAASTVLDGSVGPAVLTTTNVTLSTPGLDTVPTAATFAAILRPVAAGGAGVYNTIILTNQSGFVDGIFILSGALDFWVSGGPGDFPSGINLTNGVPYFVAASFGGSSGNPVNFLVKNLQTGAVQTASVTVTGVLIRTDNTVVIGDNSFTESSQSQIAAGMYSRAVLSPAQLMQWAEDPWAFWYPNKVSLPLQASTPATAFVPAFRTNVRQWMLPNATFYNQTAVPSGGSIFNAAINAAASGAVSVGKSIGKSIAVACTSAMSLLKSVGKKIAITCSGAVSIAKNVGKKIAATCSGAVTATAIKVKLVLVTAASTGAVIIQRSIGKPIASACSGAVSLVRNIGKSIAASCTGTVSSIKSITKKVLATCVGAVTAAAIKVKIVIVSAASSGAVVVIRAIGKPLAIVSTGSVSTAKVIAHAVNVASTTATSFAKLISKIVSASASAIVAITQNIGQSGHFVYNVAIAVSSSTLTQWLVRKVTKLTSREALPRNSGWPAAPRDDD